VSERRSTAMLRVPFVRLCALEFDSSRRASAFIANINILGAYLAWDEPTIVGEGLNVRFGSAGNAIEITSRGVVAWVNPKQQHLVHSLPPGFGVKFVDLSPEAARRIEGIVQDYVARQPQTKR
jgi:Tfp pilus assembly protein PilZ